VGRDETVARTVREADVDDLARLSATLADAFIRDPILQRLAPSQRSDRRLRRLIESGSNLGRSSRTTHPTVERAQHALCTAVVESTARMQLQRLDHVSLNVTDRARAIAWYRDVLGLPQLNQPTEDDEPVFLGQPGLQFGLFQAQRESPAREPESSGLRHVAIVVDDLDAAQERLRSYGVEFRYEDHGNALSVYFGDPDGHVLEITKYVR
jgi:catechol 2,3-dioxygenase-like lactoylglutathione lyase family enzyme